jgi:phage tail sheath protein FI
MPQYRSPGVYVEEIDAGPKPIEGVSTSICGAVGMTKRGPTSGKPVLCTSFLEFTRTFGGYWEKPPNKIIDQVAFDRWSKNTDGGYWWQFPLAVKAFFDNGGEQIYVKRVFHQDLQTPANSAVSSKAAAGRGLASRVAQDAASGTKNLKLAHLIGIGAGLTPVDVVNGETRQPLPGGPFTVQTIESGTNFVTLDKPVGADVKASRGDFLEVFKIAPAATTLSFEANSTGVWGDDLSVQVEPMVGNTLSLLVDPVVGQDPAAVMTVSAVAPNTPNPGESTLTVDAVTGFPGGDLADGQRIVINGSEYVVSGLNKPNKTFVIGGTASVEDNVRRPRGANSQAHPDTLNVWGASALYKDAIVELTAPDLTKEILKVSDITGQVVTFSANPAGAYLEGNKLRVIEARVTISYDPKVGDATDEVFENLSFAKAEANYILTEINGSSRLVTLPAAQAIPIPTSLTQLKDLPATEIGKGAKFQNGNDKLDKLTSDDFVGVDRGSGKRTGIQALEDITDASIVIVPGMWSPVIQSALITHCETLKSRFAILDPKPKLGIQEIQEFRAPFDTKYAALYYPWVVVRDPSVSENVEMAPSGHMAGLYARVDNERGVHKAPANEVIRGIQKLADDVTKREQDLLNPKNINALRYFPGRGNRVWGARVVTSDAAWKYINVRRLFIYVEQSIDVGTQWVVFEPNDEPLWARVRQTITNFLTTVWRSGALQGGKAEEAFFVKCDYSTMTQDDIDNGRLICLIGIAPVKPAEFVIFRIQQKMLDRKTA